MHADNSDLLFEAIPESLKNMLLVMSTAGIFECHQDSASEPEALPSQFKADSKCRQYSALWQVTWERIDCFLPNLKADLIATRSPVTMRAVIPPEPEAPGAMIIHSDDEISRNNPEPPAAPTTEATATEPEADTESTTTVTPVVSPSVDDSPTKSSCPSIPSTPDALKMPSASDRSLSPLLPDDPPIANIQLVAPLPHLSPPGNVIPIHDNSRQQPQQ